MTFGPPLNYVCTRDLYQRLHVNTSAGGETGLAGLERFEPIRLARTLPLSVARSSNMLIGCLEHTRAHHMNVVSCKDVVDNHTLFT